MTQTQTPSTPPPSGTAPVRALVVDDEAPARQRLVRMINENLAGRVEVVGEAIDGASALAAIAEHEPDLLFLDVQMPGIDGLELVARMPHPQPYVIFTTAHDRYALDAFDAGAVGYLLKPFDATKLVKAFSQAESRGLRERATEVLAPLIAHVRASKPLSDKLPVTVNDRVILVPVAEISHCKVEHELVVVYTRRQSYTTDYTLTALESRLDANRFFRANRALLVNLDHVAAIDDLPGGRVQLVTDTGEKLDVSRQSSRKLRGLLGV